MKHKPASITYLRDTEGAAYGFDCACGYTYAAPTSLAQDLSHRGNLVDCMIRHHENKHKAGKFR